MAFLGDDELIKGNSVAGEEWIIPFDAKHIKSASYELALGGEAFMSDSKDGKPELLSATNSTIEINPGQFAILMTDEKITVPPDKIAFISIRAGIKFRGLVNVSGFHVDPGFSGPLFFSVYNAGAAKITLRKGDRYFVIWFSELKKPLDADEVYNASENSHQGLTAIPTKYIDALKSGELASPNVLLEKIKDVEATLKDEQTKIREKQTTNDWLAKIAIGAVFGFILTVVGRWTFEKIGDRREVRSVREEVNDYVDKAVLDAKIDSIVFASFHSIQKVGLQTGKDTTSIR